jgi:S1-C subfamily serine protease
LNQVFGKFFQNGMNMKILVLMLSLLLFGVVQGENKFDINKAEDICVIVDHPFGMASGTALEIDGKYYILTVKHIVEPPVLDANGEPVVIDTVTIINGPIGIQGWVVAKDTANDASLIEIEEPISTNFADLADSLPAKASEMHHIGMFRGLKGEDSYSHGYVSKPVSSFLDDPAIQMDCSTIPGSSGGPVFDNNMTCYGIAMATDEYGRSSYYVPSVEIVEWLRTLQLD